MNIKHLNKVTPYIAASLVLFISVASAPSANAGFFSWFSNNSANESTDNYIADYPKSFFTSNVGLAIQSNDAEINDNLINVVQNNFVIQSTEPIKIQSKIQKLNFTSIKNEYVLIATAYSSTPDQTDDSPFITAWNTTVRDGIIAANFLPFGTKVRIPSHFGDKIFVVEDRMNKRYSERIDIWYPDRESAKQFGVRTVKIQVLE